MASDFDENSAVRDAAGDVFQDELGWDVVLAYNNETFGPNGTFGRISAKDILLPRYLKDSIKKLNPWINDAQVDEVIKKLESRLATESLMQTNQNKYNQIRDGIQIAVKAPNGKTIDRTAILIDFANPNNNHFLAAKELWVHGDLYRKRPDIVGFVNGIPLLFIELKRHDVDVEDAYNNNYQDYLTTIPHLFYYNAFLMLSNGFQAKVGTLQSPFEFFHEWKRLSEDDDKGSVELETMLRGICKKENFLDLLENFILYDKTGGHTVKILARNHQYLGVNEAVKAYQCRRLNEGKLGVFWHTQGSGKSYSMVFLSQKIRRKFEGSPTIVILTDREELNTQISDTFENCGVLSGTKASQFIASSSDDLINKLKGNPSFIFTLIQKFNQPDLPAIESDHDIIVMSDEAHRSQYGFFAENMMSLIPNASRIGFTGTPLLSDDKITERTFGGYVSVYDFQRAVADGATVPLYYENRGEKIKEIDNPELNKRIIEAIEKAELDPIQQEKLEREFAKEIHILTAQHRLEVIAKDFVQHYSDLWTSGKAMFVCLNKVTCVRMYNLVDAFWKKEIEFIENQIKNKQTTQQESQELQRKLQWMKDTEMAVVISSEQNEIKTFEKWGLDIRPHREKIEKEELDKRFKDPTDPFRIVFVCAMWLTGFDVKCLSTLYLDKPLKAHNLMQTIARANRVSEGKSNGLVIDYIGIVKALRQALADYTTSKEENDRDGPTVNKEELVKRILELISGTSDYLSKYQFNLQTLVNADPKGFTRLRALRDAADAMCTTLETKKTYCNFVSEINRLMKFADRKDIPPESRKQRTALNAIYSELQKKRKSTDITDLTVTINEIVNEYVHIDEQTPGRQRASFNLGGINFELLAKEFNRIKNKNLVMKDLTELIQEKLDQVLENNPDRIDFIERYKVIIEEYNQDQDKAAIEKAFEELIKLAESLDAEQNRYIAEGFSDPEELRIFDLINSNELSKKDIKAIKEVAVELLAKIKERIRELHNWTEKEETRANVEVLIRDTLWTELPSTYSDDLFQICQKKVFEHVCLRYKDFDVGPINISKASEERMPFYNYN